MLLPDRVVFALVAAFPIALVACQKPAPATGAPPDTSATAPGVGSAAAVFDTSCLSDGDCVPAPACCEDPCTTNVINAAELPRAQRLLACPPDRVCPVVSDCSDHAYLCVEGRCALVYASAPGYRSPRAPPGPLRIEGR